MKNVFCRQSKQGSMTRTLSSARLYLTLLSLTLMSGSESTRPGQSGDKPEKLQVRNRVVLSNGKAIDLEPRLRSKSENLYGNFELGGYADAGLDYGDSDLLLEDGLFARRRRRRRLLLRAARRRAIMRRRLRNLLLGYNATGDRLRPDALGLRGVKTYLPTVPGEEGVVPLDADQFEGSYVAISGRPGQRTLHVVNGRGGVNFAGTVSRRKGISVNGNRLRPLYEEFGYDYDLTSDLDGVRDTRLIPGVNLNPKPSNQGQGKGKGPNYLKVDFTDFAGYSPLPRCSYINTDFLGDDVGDGKGISTGGAIACKQACQASNICKFWTFRDGWARDCYLKRGRRGDPNPTGAIPKIGFVSGTKGNDDCLCLPNGANSDEEICPVKSSRPVFPWRNVDGTGRTKERNDGDRPFRFDYDDYELGQTVEGIDDGILPLVRKPSDRTDYDYDFEDLGSDSSNSRSNTFMSAAESSLKRTIKQLSRTSGF